MKVAIVSDIHGNYQALQAVLQDISKLNIHKIISLGDNIGYGPEPEPVVKALMERNVTSIMGNHELALVSRSYFNRLNEIPQESLVLSLKMLSDQSISWLKNLQPVYFWSNTRFVHGSPPESITAYLYSPTRTRLQRLFSLFSERICFSGHTHSLDCFEICDQKIESKKLDLGENELVENGRYIVLPGSVGQPRDGINYFAKYCVWDQDNDIINIRAVEYDVDKTIHLLKEGGFHHFNAMRLKWAGK